MEDFYEKCVTLMGQKLYESAYEFCRLGEEATKDEALKSKFIFQKSLAAFALGKIDEFATLCDTLMRQKVVDESIRNINRNNMWYAYQQLQHLEIVDISKKICLYDFASSNPSIIKYNDKLIINIMCHNFYVASPSNYWVKSTKAAPTVEHPIVTRNFLFEADLKLKNIKFWKELKPQIETNANATDLGFKDMRLFVKEAQLCGIGTRYDTPNPNIQMSIVDIETEKSYWVNFCKDQVQKNWSPLKDRFVYCLNPYITLQIDEKGDPYNIKLMNTTTYVEARGSSQYVPIQGGYIGIIHDVIMKDERRVYMSRNVTLDEKMEIKRISKPYYLFHKKIEYICGLERIGNKFYISASIEDSEAFIVVVDADYFIKF